MSLILEALKKSEANRRLGQAPDLGTPFTPSRRERSPLWALLVIILALGAGAWWLFGRRAIAPVPVSGTPPVAAKPAATAASSAQASSHRTSPPGPPKQQPHVAQTTPANDQQMWVAAQRSREGQARNATAHPRRMPRPAPASPPMAPRTQEPVVAAPATHSPAPAPTPMDAHARAPAPAPHPDAIARPQPHPDAPPPAPGTPKLDVPTYYDLPFATRKALPQLNLSMHVYTADPKQRFIMLDGSRLAEGDTTADNVTVREIRPDGVVLEFQGQRFFYPRGGL